MNLTIFNELDFLPALRAFFAELQVPIASVTDARIPAREILENSYKGHWSANRGWLLKRPFHNDKKDANTSITL